MSVQHIEVARARQTRFRRRLCLWRAHRPDEAKVQLDDFLARWSNADRPLAEVDEARRLRAELDAARENEKAPRSSGLFIEVPPGFEPGNDGFAVRCLTSLATAPSYSIFSLLRLFGSRRLRLCYQLPTETRPSCLRHALSASGSVHRVMRRRRMARRPIPRQVDFLSVAAVRVKPAFGTAVPRVSEAIAARRHFNEEIPQANQMCVIVQPTNESEAKLAKTRMYLRRGQ
jgi:hypothetical protein